MAELDSPPEPADWALRLDATAALTGPIYTTSPSDNKARAKPYRKLMTTTLSFSLYLAARCCTDAR